MPRWPAAAARHEQPPRLPGQDGWAAFVAARLSDLQMLRLAALGLETGHGPRPWHDREWRERVELLRHDLRAVAALQQMVIALRDAVPISPPALPGVHTTDARPLLVCEANTATAVNALWAAARLSVDADRTAEATGAVLRRVVTEPWCVQSPLLRNACIGILSELANPRAVDELVGAAGLAPAKRVKAQILLALDRLSPGTAAESERIAELRVPRHGLTEDAKLCLDTRGRTDVLELLPSGDVSVVEIVDAGTPGDDHARHAVEKRIREIQATYARELARIEDLLAAQRTWPLADWSRLYLEHPITRTVACRLVWSLYLPDGSAQEVIPAPGGGLLAVDGHRAAAASTMPDEAGTMVEPWHPGTATAASLARWREYLPMLESGQPLAQIARWYAKQPPDPDGTFVADYTGCETHLASFTAVARAQRWQWRPAASHAKPRPDADADADADAVPGGLCLRESAEAHLTCAIDVALDGESVRCGRAWFHRRRDRQREPVPLGAVPYRFYSEAVRVVALLAGVELAEDEIQDLPSVTDTVADEVPTNRGTATTTPAA